MSENSPPHGRAPYSLAVALASIVGLAGCAQLPSLDLARTMKAASGYETSSAFAAPSAAWPSDRWWTVYGDAQLDALIDEALRDSPDMAAASARLRRAEAGAQVAGSPLLPQVGASAAASEQKQSYNYLMPRSALPDGWNDYGQATLNLNWEIDFWGKHRAGLAAATSQLEASRAELAQARLSLAVAIATNYAELAQTFAVRDTALRSVEVRRKTAELFDQRFANGLETRGSFNEAAARPPPAWRSPRARYWPLTSRSACSATASPPCSVPVPTGACVSSARRSGSTAPSGCRRSLPPTCWDAVPTSSPRV